MHIFAMEYTILLWLFGLYGTAEVHATTHWMVTETGLIQPRVETPFEMARPFDLLAFLNQDTRWENIKKLYVDLSKRQVGINKMWNELVKECDMNTHLGLDKNCVKAGPLNELNWFEGFMEEGLSKHIPEEQYHLFTPADLDANPQVPDCKKTLSLTFSMFTFDHLESMTNLSNLTITPELSLPELVSPLMTVEQFGQWVHRVLTLNDSSWIHYNMASLFWRIQGNAPKAIECSRRAIYLAPRVYKDVALLSLGTILHRAKKSKDAIIILKAAIDHDPLNIYANFILANAYAIIGDFDLSLKYFEETLKFNPGFEQAVKNKFGMLCQRELIKKMIFINKKLQALRQEISNFITKEDIWLQIQAHFLKTRKDSDELDYRRADNIVMKMTELMGINIKDLKKEGDKNAIIQYFLNGPLYSDKWITERGVQIIDAAFSIQRLMKHIEKQGHISPDNVFVPEFVNVSSAPLQKELGPLPAVHLGRRNHLLCGNTESEGVQLPEPQQKTTNAKSKSKDVDETEEYEVGPPLFPNTMTVNRNTEGFDREPSEWPTVHDCKHAVPLNSELTVYPVFLPFENKGLSVKGILTDKIGVSADVEHDLPWHPPNCPAAKEAAAAVKKAQKTQLVLEVLPPDLLRVKLREYVSGGDPTLVDHMQDAEIGQRIYKAMRNDVAPKWMLYSLAALYWRVRNNNVNALNCLMSANKRVKSRLRDLVYTSMSSVYLEMGYVEEAIKYAEEAYKIAMYEPATNFMLFQLHMIKKNRHAQMFYLKQVVRVEGRFMSNAARTLLINWACVLWRPTVQVHHYNYQEYKEAWEGAGAGGCARENADADATDSDHSRAGSHTKTEEVHRTATMSPRSTLGKLMQITDPTTQPEEIGHKVFDEFITNTLNLNVADKKGHIKNMKYMIELIKSFKGCGVDGCHSLTKETMEMREEECLFQYVQLQLWLQTITIQYLIAGEDGLISEVTSLVPSTKMIPDCRLYDNPATNFYLGQLIQTDDEGWQPKRAWKKQLADYFQGEDFDTLGAKFATYVDNKPRCWWGLLGAGWWCGVAGRGACAVRCLVAAWAAAPPSARNHSLVALVLLLHKQHKLAESARISYLAFYLAPKSKLEAFLVGVSNTYMMEFDSAVWMYRYAVTFDPGFLPAKACVHSTMCLQLFPEKAASVDDINEHDMEKIQEAIIQQNEGAWSFY